MAGPGKPPHEETPFGDEEIFVESPTEPTIGVLPEDAGEIPMIAAPLPEMGPDIWQAGIQALVSVSDGASGLPVVAEEWAWEARMLRDESGLTDSPAEAGTLLLAAANAALLADDVEAAEGLLNRALAGSPGAPDLLRARARLAESRGDYEGAQGSWTRLATAAESADERAFYAALAAEWTLSRLGTLAAAARDAVAAGPARALAVAEAALAAGEPADVSSALGEAGRALGGALGAVLLEEAARFSETTGDRARAAGLRGAALALAPETPGGIFSRLRDAARADERNGAGLLAEAAADLPAASGLARALRRAGAGLARRRGDVALAGHLLGDLPPATAAVARDRIDFEVQAGAALDAASLERLAADASAGAGAATLAWVEAGSLLQRGEVAAAVARVARGIDENPDAVVLGFIAEEIADLAPPESVPGELRARCLELWLRVDAARRAEAALALASAREASGGEGSALAARAALQTAIEAAPGSALFWTVAAVDARAGRHADAAATLGYGAETWAGSPLAAALQACAVRHLAVVDPARAQGGLNSPEVVATFGADARALLAARAGDKDALLAALGDAAGATDDPGRRAFLAVRRAMLLDDAAARMSGLGEALAAVPQHPLALPLALLQETAVGGAPASALWRAGEAAGPGALGELYRLTAAIAADLRGDGDDALRRASELVDSAPHDRVAHLALIRAAVRLDPDRRARAIAELPVSPTSDPVVAFVVAEALIEAGEGARAAVVLRELGRGRFATEARRALAGLGVEGGEHLPSRLLFGAADEAAAVIRAELAELTDAVQAGRWDGVVAALESGPPHESVAGPATLHAAAAIADGRGAGAGATGLEGAALAAAGEGKEEVPLLGLGWIAGAGGAADLRARALELCAKRFAEAGLPHALAIVDSELARLHEAAGEPERAAESWRAALAADPTCLPAALALRREVARARDVRAAIDATEVEAARLLVPANRVRALLLAAALAEEAARGGEAERQSAIEAGTPPQGPTAPSLGGRGRALRLLRAALEIDPAHDAAFEQLRSLLEEEGDAAGLAAALEARIAVASNPFEVTSLRLARADLLAGKLGDRAGARQELDGILHKQPEHPRALARLAELLWEEESWSEAGEVTLRRAVVEREPRTLREIFLRLGHIYGERVPDAKRAVAAYERVRSLEPDNREALRALSNLYFAEGDMKLALPVTERMVIVEPDGKRRAAFQVRLGEILMRAGDLRRAGVELRRAVDAAPRDLAAVVALAQLLERARDPMGRRALLDHTVGLLRHDLERGELEVATLRGLTSLLALRDGPRAAAAAAALLAALEPGKTPSAAPGAGLSLEALRRPEVEERAFPPALPPGIRQIMRLVGPALRGSGAELAQQLSASGITRAERVARGAAPRPAFDAVAAELRAGEFDLYVTGSARASGRVPVRVEPGVPPAIIVGAAVVDLGAAAVRFAAARTLRLVATGLDVLLAASPEEAGAIVVGVIRQFVPEYRHPGVGDVRADAAAARAAHVIPRKLRPQLMPFAVESAGPFDLEGLHAAVRDGANAAGLLASGDLPSALSVVLATAGVSAPLTLSSITAEREALALVRFALSDEHDELARAMESS